MRDGLRAATVVLGVWAVALTILVACSGCASITATSMIDREKEAAVTRVEHNPVTGETRAMMDLSRLDDGYWAAWKSHPWVMAGATIIDAICAAVVGSQLVDLWTRAEDDPEPADAGDVYNVYNYPPPEPEPADGDGAADGAGDGDAGAEAAP